MMLTLGRIREPEVQLDVLTTDAGVIALGSRFKGKEATARYTYYPALSKRACKTIANVKPGTWFDRLWAEWVDTNYGVITLKRTVLVQKENSTLNVGV